MGAIAGRYRTQDEADRAIEALVASGFPAIGVRESDPAGGVLVRVEIPEERAAEGRMIFERTGGILQDEPRAKAPSNPVSPPGIRTDEPLVEPVDPNVVAADREGVVGAVGASGAVVGGVIGTLAAGPLGGAVGVAAGALAGAAAAAALDFGSVEPEFHRDWQTGPHRDRVPWELAGPAYRYGWESFDRLDYRGHSWDEVRPELERGWIGGGPWSDAEPMVRAGWHRRVGLRAEDSIGSRFPRDGGNA